MSAYGLKNLDMHKKVKQDFTALPHTKHYFSYTSINVSSFPYYPSKSNYSVSGYCISIKLPSIAFRNMVAIG